MNDSSFDFVIIGAGLAGLYASLNASKYGSVALISKTPLNISNSYLAQGGVAAVIGEDDSPESHIEDTLDAGRGLCSEEAVDILVNEGIRQIESLIEMGMPFDISNGKIALGLEGGHSKRRILHAGGDATGKALVNFILPLVMKEKKIKIFENIYAYELISDGQCCLGVRCFDPEKQNLLNLTAGITIIASGGASAIYSRTTNPPSTAGEGITLAYNIGAEIESMEFIQFHPTAFYSGKGEAFLISEAVRGEGAHLINYKGERFLEKTGCSELSPRDIVSRAIFHEIQKCRMPNVFLKLDHISPALIKKRFSTIYHNALINNIDITCELIPVAPAAHYMIGGIKTGLNGETNIEGFYAAGEAASTGVHGANRLASNSLLECLVFSKRAVDHAILNRRSSAGVPESNLKFTLLEENRIELGLIRKRVGAIMWNNAGIERSRNSLEIALTELISIEEKINPGNREYYTHKTRSLITVAKMIVESALIREESRGCHIRTDFISEESDFLQTTILNNKCGPYFTEPQQKLDKKCV